MIRGKIILPLRVPEAYKMGVMRFIREQGFYIVSMGLEFMNMAKNRTATKNILKKKVYILKVWKIKRWGYVEIIEDQRL